jgi:NodT family efflux transporter outer membrane factor (OMF) lipoprotein
MNKPILPMAAVLAVAALLLSSCSVGPDYVRPKADAPVAYKEVKGWKQAEPRDHVPRGKWWEMFDDPELNALEAQVDISNLNVAVAESRYRQALELLRAARSGYFPVVAAQAIYERGSSSYHVPLSKGDVSSVYTLPLTVSWELDLWGRVRRQVEAQSAGAQASAADLESVRLSAQADLAQAYFQLRAIDAQKELLDRTIEAYQKAFELTQNRYAGGIVSRADVLQAETQLKTVRAQAIDLGVQRARLEHAIALLCGKAPADLTLPFAPLRTLLPGIPVGIPSEILERRPDIAAAERLMAAANAQIGVAIAAYYPAISLGASIGLQSTEIGNLISRPSRFWSLGPALTETLFTGGLRRAQTAQARAAYDTAVASYRQTVLNGFREVEDDLAALRILDEEAGAQNEAVAASRKTLEVVTNQYKAGTVGYLSVVTAQAVMLANERVALDILNRRMNASVLLIKALGGGWDASLLNKPQAPGKR